MIRNFVVKSVMLGIVMCAIPATAQSRRPIRARAPEFKQGEFDGVFFSDVATLLKGDLPGSQTVLADSLNSPPNASTVGPTSTSPAAGTGMGDEPLAWHKLISPTSLEDLIKGSKLRLEKLITTPPAFAGGGYVEARREFSLQALLFAIVEAYPAEVRWKKSGPRTRELMARIAANTKVGSIQTFNEAKQRMLDLNDLMNGAQLDGEAKSEVDWSNLIDRVPLMQLLEWSQQDYVAKLTSSETSVAANADEVKRYAQLIAVLGKAALQAGMPDATDADYMQLAHEMIAEAGQVAQAVDNGNAELARQAAGKIGQSCTNCHDSFR